MESPSLALAFMCVMGLAMVHVSQAQNSPQDFLDAHNTVRAQVNVGAMTWDTTVEAYAQDYAKRRSGDCQLVHSNGQYGENIFWGSGGYTGVDAVNSWVSESADYDHTNNMCASSKVCGHYTQVVWSDSVRLGCARVTCNGGGVFITCNYDPPGNVEGQSPY